MAEVAEGGLRGNGGFFAHEGDTQRVLAHFAATLEQFMALGLHRTRDRTGVLLYVSVAERRAEVFADDGIHAKAPPEVWGEVVDRLIGGLKRGAPADGFVAAIERTGEILAAYLPPRDDDTDELANDLVTR